MKKIIIFMTLFIYCLQADSYMAKIYEIRPDIKKRMLKGNSWRQGCPVGLKNLRYLQIQHHDFKGATDIGELIVHKDVAKIVTKIFEELYHIGYPIRQMRLISDFRGNDWQSIEADNTSALNCRSVTRNKKKWSNHAFGKAIDINPIENPYISRTGYISHKASGKYRQRKHNSKRGLADKAMILKNDPVIKIFKKYGWSWGGDWSSVKDYQHFEYGR